MYQPDPLIISCRNLSAFAIALHLSYVRILVEFEACAAELNKRAGAITNAQVQTRFAEISNIGILLLSLLAEILWKCTKT